MNPFRKLAEIVWGRDPRASARRLHLGRGVELDAMAINRCAEQLGISELVADYRGHPHPTRMAPGLRTATERTVELVLGLAASFGCREVHLAVNDEEIRFDVRLVAIAAEEPSPAGPRDLLAELRDWAFAFDGDVAMYTNDESAVWIRVDLALGIGDPPPDLLTPDQSGSWAPVALPAGRVFGHDVNTRKAAD